MTTTNEARDGFKSWLATKVSPTQALMEVVLDLVENDPDNGYPELLAEVRKTVSGPVAGADKSAMTKTFDRIYSNIDEAMHRAECEGEDSLYAAHILCTNKMFLARLVQAGLV